MKIQVGLVGPSSAWEQLCEQEGVPCKRIDRFSDELGQICSIVVVNRPLAEAEKENVLHYLHRGGAILGPTRHLSQFNGIGIRKEQLEYILSEQDKLLPDISLIDLAVGGEIAREANTLRTQAGSYAMFAGPFEGGYAVALPFDVNDVLSDSRVANKSFYAKVERLPTERVSLVTKGELRYLLHKAFEYLHHVRGLWYAHLWYFPGECQSIFAFRVDTDRSKPEEIDALYTIARHHDCSLSWFLDVKSHGLWLRHFDTLVDQEMGVHCYEHQVYPTPEANLRNISRAVREMQSAGFDPRGFAAPYGIWTPELALALDQLEFEYSSEFSYAYDTFPLYPEIGAGTCATLQVPIHPICIGSMMRVGYSDAQMKEYFRMIIDFKWQRHEPLFFYHHPIHKRWEVVDFIFDYIQHYSAQNMTLGEYARWWKGRIKEGLSLEFVNDGMGSESLSSSSESNREDVRVHVSVPGGEHALVPVGERIDRSTVSQWDHMPVPFLPPTDVRRIREFDLRGTLGDIYTTITRKLK